MRAGRRRVSVATRLTPYLVVALASGLAASSAAQIPGGILPPTPSPRPSPTPAPTPEPGPSPTPAPALTPAPQPSALPVPPPSPSPTSGPASAPLPTAGPPVPPPLVPGAPPGVQVPVLPRTPPRSTVRLVRILERATEVGLPLQQVLLEGMGRLPVAGVAFWSDDWMAPRFTPYFHLHEGLDIFADFGTPVRAPDRGVVARLTDGPIGGLAVWLAARDGTQYYFAHLQGYAPGIAPGTPVDVGTVLGYVGDTGNAQGGPPHLHFEVHRGGPIPPKPIVDGWLQEAERQAPAWVEERIRAVLGERALLRSRHALAGLLAAERVRPSGTPEYSILLTLLDPVGGSVGLLPDLPIVPRAAQGSSRLLEELIRIRVNGTIVTALVTGIAPRTDAGGS